MVIAGAHFSPYYVKSRPRGGAASTAIMREPFHTNPVIHNMENSFFERVSSLLCLLLRPPLCW